MALKKISLDKLEIDEENSRDDPHVTNEFIDNIKERDVIEPLLVRPKGDGTYGIVAGSRRYMAAVNAGIDEVPCKVKDMDDIDASINSLSENIFRDDMDSKEKENEVHDIWEEGEWDKMEELAEKLGVSRSTIEDKIKAAKLRKKEDIPDKVSTRDINSVAGLEKEDREKLLKKRAEGDVESSDIRDIRSQIDDADDETRNKILGDGRITPQKVRSMVGDDSSEKEETASDNISIEIPDTLSEKVVEYSSDAGVEPEKGVKSLIKSALEVKGYD